MSIKIYAFKSKKYPDILIGQKREFDSTSGKEPEFFVPVGEVEYVYPNEDISYVELIGEFELTYEQLLNARFRRIENEPTNT
jgi:hypothetical protein